MVAFVIFLSKVCLHMYNDFYSFAQACTFSGERCCLRAYCCVFQVDEVVGADQDQIKQLLDKYSSN